VSHGWTIPGLTSVAAGAAGQGSGFATANAEQPAACRVLWAPNFLALLLFPSRLDPMTRPDVLFGVMDRCVFRSQPDVKDGG